MIWGEKKFNSNKKKTIITGGGDGGKHFYSAHVSWTVLSTFHVVVHLSSEQTDEGRGNWGN